jgi:ribose/xylose/arabinose/galactoside ABC-type transport system permease subunit
VTKTTDNTMTKSRAATSQSWLATVDPQIVGLVIALSALVIIFGIRMPGEFFRPVNLMSISEGVTLIGLTALAQTTVMIMGGLDISIGSLMGACSAAAGMAMMSVNSPVVGVLAALTFGVVGGLINGLIITKGRLDPVIVTLGTYTAFRGVALLTLPGGYAVVVRNVAFNSLGGAVAGIPIPVIVLVVAIALFIFVMGYTAVGRNIYAIGGNPAGARLAGVNIARYKIGVYVLAGLMAGVAGIMLTARIKSAQPISGSEGMEMQAITAAILGGISTKGGRGAIIGAMLGVLILGTLNNGMILLSIPTFYQRVARGVLLVAAALVQTWQMRASAARLKKRANAATL